jgi:hypothetical protein
MTLELHEAASCPVGRHRRFKRGEPPAQQVAKEELDKAVVNLSTLELTPVQQMCLYKGLGFAIQPAEFQRRDTLEGFVSFKRKILRATGPSSHEGKAFCSKVGEAIQQIPVSRSKGNLTLEERASIAELRGNDSIVIKPADKGRAVVVWDRSLYVSEMRRQLDDANTYRRESQDLTISNEAAICKQLEQLEVDGMLQPDDVDRLKPRGTRTPPIYGLPKIHKLSSPIVYSPSLSCKARPIVGAVGCATEQISAFVDAHIRTLARQVPSYLKDTTDFLRLLSSIGNVEPGTLLVTADVASLYPSIPHDDGLRALETALDTRESLVPPTQALKTLAKIVLDYNHFTFDGDFYTQISGTAMGTKFAPNYAILFMHEFETTLLKSADPSPQYWCRYIDDIFFVWPHGEEALLRFIQQANSQNQSIQLTFEYSPSEVNFLDVQVRLEDGVIVTDLYRKPTDSQMFLSYSSCHPTSHKLPIAYSQALRIVKICSKRVDAFKHCKELKDSLVKRGYPRGPVERCIQKALHANREALIFPPPPADEELTTIPLVVPYHPDIAQITNILKSHEGLLTGHPIATKVFWKPPRTLRSILVSSRLRPIAVNVDRSLTHQTLQGMQRCGRPRCLTCPMVSNTAVAISSKTGLTYKLPPSSCSSRNVVYMLSFDNCNAQYVGQTRTPLNIRINNHRSAAKPKGDKKQMNQPVPFHINCSGHDHDWDRDVKVTVLDVIQDSQDLDRAEFFWISQLMTDHPFSLNIQHVMYRNCFSMDQVHQME